MGRRTGAGGRGSWVLWGLGALGVLALARAGASPARGGGGGTPGSGSACPYPPPGPPPLDKDRWALVDRIYARAGRAGFPLQFRHLPAQLLIFFI